MANTYVDYDEENVVKTTLAQDVAAKVIGGIAGIGAAGIVGTAAGLIMNCTKTGKLMKVIYIFGVAGMGMMVSDKVSNFTANYMTETFGAINELKAAFNKRTEEQ